MFKRNKTKSLQRQIEEGQKQEKEERFQREFAEIKELHRWLEETLHMSQEPQKNTVESMKAESKGFVDGLGRTFV